MLSKDFEILVVNLPDRENLVAEIYYKDYQWAEINQELSDAMIVQFYSHPKQKYWEFSLEEAMTALAQAKQRLLNLGSTRRVNWTLQSSGKADAIGDTDWKTTEIVACKAKPNHILWIRFDDGLEGEVDLSEKVSPDIFKAWESEEFWQSVRIDPDYGTVCWGTQIYLDPYILKEEILNSRKEKDLP